MTTFLPDPLSIYEPEPICRTCGEEFTDCLCDEFEQVDYHDEADRDFDARTERWEGQRQEW